MSPDREQDAVENDWDEEDRGESEFEQFGMGIFNPDYDLDGPSPMWLLVNYAEKEDLDALRALDRQLSDFDISGIDEARADYLWMTFADSSYDPTDEGMTYKQWLETVHRVIKEGIAARSKAGPGR